MLSNGQTQSSRYRLVQKLDEGDTGEVYEASHIKLCARFAVRENLSGENRLQTRSHTNPNCSPAATIPRSLTSPITSSQAIVYPRSFPGTNKLSSRQSFRMGCSTVRRVRLTPNEILM